jgi:ferredoxin
MNYLPQIFFLLILATTAIILTKRISNIRKSILLGKDVDMTDQKDKRLKNMLLVAFGQKKMFKRPIPAFLHLFLYVGFIVINLEVLEFMIDAILGTHRIFAPYGGVYTVMMNIFEFLALAVIISCVIFLLRREALKVKRFHAYEMKKWPRLDATLILLIEISLMLAILSMNATDQLLQQRAVPGYPPTGPFFISGLLTPLFAEISNDTLWLIERVAWWYHIIGIFAFAIYITYSKHLHIFLAFPNTYYVNLKPKGKMTNMDEVTNEVKIMLGIAQDSGNPPAAPGRFGAKDVNDLSWKNILDAYSCTECGRCTSECPANITGKALSPRKIMMDTRDRAEEVVGSYSQGKVGLEDGKTLFGDYITKEEINACTSCQACVEACPVNIDPLSIILQIRRYMAMEESSSPASWNSMFSNIETSFAPWKFSPSDRFNWSQELQNENKKV